MMTRAALNVAVTVATVVTVVALAAPLGVPCRAGSLEPPGPPAPTMKTLLELEPRIAVEELAGSAAALHVIDQPGSYLLGANVVGESGRAGILIAADNVTLDLGGFTLQGVSDASAIVVDGPHASVTVRNGTIRGWGGSALLGEECTGCVATGLLARENGTGGTYPAIRLGSFARVHDCSAIDNPNWTGIQVGDRSIVSGSTANSNARGYELSGESNLILRSHAMNNADQGIYMQAAGIVSGCVAQGNASGITVGSDAIVRDNTVWANAIGVHVDGEDALVESNHVKNNFDWGLHTAIVFGGTVLRQNRCVGNGLGINTDASGTNLVIGNTLAGNTTDIFGGGAYGELLDFTGGTSITGGSPWANVRY